MLSRKNIIIVDLICLGIIILAVTVRISKSLPQAYTDPREKADKAYQNAISGNPNLFAEKISAAIPKIKEQTKKVPTQENVQQSPKTDRKAEISARSYLVGNVRTGEIYLSNRPDVVLPVASMSKLVTAIAAIETIPMDREIYIDDMGPEVWPDSSKIGAGESFTTEELLYPLLLSSSNIAAEAMASSSGRIPFLELMSSYAWEVGMPKTFFADPSGLSSLNISTAKDFFALAKYLYGERQDILSLTRMPMAHTSSTSDHGSHEFISTHPFVNNPDFLGGKTGRTPEARETMLTIMSIKGEPIAFVILSSENRKADTEALIRKYQEIVQ